MTTSTGSHTPSATSSAAPRILGGSGEHLVGITTVPAVSVNEGESAVPFRPRIFMDFVALLGRTFHDDSCIILLDFLAKEQKALTEADIREKLKWRDALVHQKLYAMERQLLISRQQSLERGPKSPVFWRINPYIVYAADWHYNQMMVSLAEKIEAANRLQEFQCIPCDTRFSSLDAASGDTALEDGHPLCSKCGEKLVTSRSKAAKTEVANLHQRATDQLAEFTSALQKMKTMEIPIFPIYTRAEKNEAKRGSQKAAEEDPPAKSPAPSSTIAASPTPPSSSVTSKTQLSITSAAPKQAAGSRAIPWFQNQNQSKGHY